MTVVILNELVWGINLFVFFELLYKCKLLEVFLGSNVSCGERTANTELWPRPSISILRSLSYLTVRKDRDDPISVCGVDVESKVCDSLS